MNNTPSIKTWIQYFLLPVFIFILSCSCSFAENLNPEPIVAPVPASPTQYIYSLEAAINNYKDIYKNGGWPTFHKGKTIKIGMHDTRIPTVRSILSIMGDLKEEENNNTDILDEQLVEAIKRFQLRHDLDVDGALGPKTQTAIAVPVEFRIAQMQATLERMQAMPELEYRYIIVNVPGYYLQAVENNTVTLYSRIIVGQPKHSTPIFDQPITQVSFNPAWYVPESIAHNELMDKLREDPEYFTKGDFIVTDSDGDEVDIEDIDWADQDGTDYKFVQRAGDKNALGRVKFNLPNTNNIYLHSTGSPRLFNKSERDLSHGCIRVEMAHDLAYFVMSGNSGWNNTRIDEFYNSEDSRIINIKPVPVHVVYWISWVDETTKQPHFNMDIYQRDKERVSEILAELKNRQ